jgi:hypothetical protein
MSKNPIAPMSKENFASHMAGFPIITSPLKTVWMKKWQNINTIKAGI